MPLVVSDARGTAESLGGVGQIELVPRNCRLESYKKLKKVPSFQVTGDLVAYASPDSTYVVTRRLLDGAKKSILIGIYDFSADYMKDLLLNAMQRGVKVSLMLDIDGGKEEEVFEELERFGCETVQAPSCASDSISYFPSSHEKVIVIDGKWTLIQSGNYSKASIPFNEVDGGDPHNFVKGNRDMGVAIASQPLARFFTKVLRGDMKLQLDAEGAEALMRRRVEEPDLVEAVPAQIPVKLFPSKTFNPARKIRVTPVLTPDNYLDVIPEFLATAKKSIYIENQYIRGKHAQIVKLLTAIKQAKDKRPALDVRIILGKLFGRDDVAKEKENVKILKRDFGLKLGTNIRYIDTKRFVHCHNKLIVVDRKSALVSSQNWSNTGVGTNREAGVILHHPPIARYYADIFESDWSTAQKKVPSVGARTVRPEALPAGNFMEVRAADYQEV
jgi:phosphatidylserine/phosphatidylglycerophosphate/cardiolipin synthase-like enzyme